MRIEWWRYANDKKRLLDKPIQGICAFYSPMVYMEHYGVEACEKVFKSLGTDIIVRAECYKKNIIGRVIIEEAGSIDFIVKTFTETDNTVIQDLKHHYGYRPNQQQKLTLKMCLAPLMGELAMNHPWWQKNKKEIRKLFLDLNKTKKVLES